MLKLEVRRKIPNVRFFIVLFPMSIVGLLFYDIPHYSILQYIVPPFVVKVNLRWISMRASRL